MLGTFRLNSAAGGVFLYIAGGSLSLKGSGLVTLSPMTTGRTPTSWSTRTAPTRPR
jgi:hypothetical protein